MTAQHPDFQAELERLAYTKNYMQQILSESQRDLQSAQENIRKSMADLDYLDSSLSYLNILANARFFEMARNQKEGLEAVQKKALFRPYPFPKKQEILKNSCILAKHPYFIVKHMSRLLLIGVPLLQMSITTDDSGIWNMMSAEKFTRDIYLPNDNIKLKMVNC